MREIVLKPYIFSQGERNTSVVIQTFLLNDRNGLVFIDLFFLIKRATSPRMNSRSSISYCLMDRLNYNPKKNIYLQP